MLNGWHRLWVLIAILYLAVIIAINWSSFPTKNHIYKDWYLELCNLTGQNPDEEQRNYNQLVLILENKIEISRKIYWGTYNAMLEIRTRHESKLNSLIKEQTQVFIKLLYIWMIPLLCIYVIGWLIAWVYKGFVNPSK